MLKVEFHCHTIYSKDSLTKLETLLAACRKKGIDRVVITDHNTISGAVDAQALDPERVIIGEEIMTQAGELLAAFVKYEIPAGLPPLEAIERLREQGAFISVSHPFDRWRGGHWDLPDLLKIASQVDAIETFNARCLWPGFNQLALDFARQHNLPGTSGSDAHAVIEVGKATMQIPDFQDAASLKQVISQAQITPAFSTPWVHFLSRYASIVKKFNNRGSKKLF